ncbi:MAG: tRNA preQ1(34) S-adenosylmethionine ribosyltransferase-isomerase QueA [Sedimentisphaerales bacterium]|nr:tRNA preQ1(34) S-adenosylmethionine ribosyltransferase-isomerase QueA [Sedimentisphaerales bacterium]
MNIEQLDYDLPSRLIAQQPAVVRTDSRLLVLDRSGGLLEHRRFHDLVEYLRSGDCLVINDTRVIPARFFIRRVTGGRIEGLFLNVTDNGTWRVMLKNASRLRSNEIVTLADPHKQYQAVSNQTFTIIDNPKQGIWLIQPESKDDSFDILNRYGITPLPPYIKRKVEAGSYHTEQTDRRRYQTVFAQTAGSVAAPTAGLHFTDELLKSLRNHNIEIARITLHVGLGTFQSITTEKVEEHRMHSEFYQLDESNAAVINNTLQHGSRLVAVGTTSIRTLETLAQSGRVRPGSGWTDLFITPGYRFQVVNTIITNFHLPRTSLLALVCAFAGTEQTLTAYNEAVRNEYRFYSYGDAMLIL